MRISDWSSDVCSSDLLSNMLNQTADGKYLFNGTNTDVQPMINAGTTKTLYDAHVAGALGPGQPALGAGAGAADVITFVEDFFNTDTNWNNVPTPAPGSLQTRIEKGVDVSYGELANNDGFEEVFEALYAFANVDFQPGEAAEYEALVRSDKSRVGK